MRVESLLNLIYKKLCINIVTFVIIVIIFLISSCFLPLLLSQKINQNNEQHSLLDEGQILYSPMWNTETYLIDSNGDLNNTWYSPYLPGVSVWWLGDGIILRTIRIGIGPGTGGTGGGVQKLEWDGDVIWDFRYNTNGVMSHHDVKTLPNGNVLLIAWETKTYAEAIAAGRNPNYLSSQGLWPDHIIEVKPTGPNSGDIVWEWHAWDHLIQDYDSSKENYGVVGDHPELIDFNYWASSQSDFMHTNSIDYNEEFDQLLLSVSFYDEIWVIDHSTTTEEAAGHTGGNSGKGGDILYRWGNPNAYDAGTPDDQKFFNQHDATWIKEGYPGEGNILVFNNGLSRPEGVYSSVEEIVPPVNENGNYFLEVGEAYGPEEQTWIYTADPPTSFYSHILGGAFRLENGNTLITNGKTGEIFEVTPQKNIVWQYNTGGQLFKAVYISPEEPSVPNTPNLDCTGSLSWSDTKPGSMVTGSFQIENIGDPGSLLNWTINTSLIKWGTWIFTPEFGEGLKPEDGTITVQVSVVAPDRELTKFDGFIRVENEDNPADYELISVYLKTPVFINSFISMINYFLLRFFDELFLIGTI